MNKALNTVIYVVCSTIVLTVATLAVFFALTIPFLLISTGFLSEYRFFFLVFFFIVALLGGIFIYNAVLKLVIKKYDIEKYLLQRKQKPKNQNDSGAR
ncbi:MAG: hypothetical protein JXD23_09780 [Spirochaetales bacterium]|nr:hypothetical protein [Spirochaetales bacterium]